MRLLEDRRWILLGEHVA
jgi:hypothetical protein